MLSASVDTVVQLLHLDEPPTLWRAIGYAIAVNVALFPLLIVWEGLHKRVCPRTHHLDLPGFGTLRRLRPSKLLAWVLPTTPTRYPVSLRTPGSLDDLAGHWDVYVFTAVDSAHEELLFRGLPLAVALWTGSSPLGAVLLGTLLWASLHSLWDLPSVVFGGLLYAWLWLTGAWHLAIELHVGVNCLAHSLLRIRCWWEGGRFPRQEQPTA